MGAINKQSEIDDVMLAMDVVDTLRRNNLIVERELNSDAQDQKLLERLKNVYASQGIDVPDHVLLEGVDALRQDRFFYEPTKPSLSRSLANIYIKRHIWGSILAKILFSIIAVWLIYYIFITAPEQRRINYNNIEITQTLPAEFKRLYKNIDNLTDDNTIELRAAKIRDYGFLALDNKDIDKARAEILKLKNMNETLDQEYDLRIISNVNETSGVFRIPDNNPDARNYYIIVEPVSSQGQILSIDVLNEENNKKSKTNKIGIHVPLSTFESVFRDKQDDGIIQNNIIGTKRRGEMMPDYSIPVLNGTITEW